MPNPTNDDQDTVIETFRMEEKPSKSHNWELWGVFLGLVTGFLWWTYVSHKFAGADAVITVSSAFAAGLAVFALTVLFAEINQRQDEEETTNRAYH